MYTAYCRNSGILVPYFGMLYWLHAIDGSVFDLCIRRQLPTTAYWTLPHHVLIDTFTMHAMSWRGTARPAHNRRLRWVTSVQTYHAYASKFTHNISTTKSP